MICRNMMTAATAMDAERCAFAEGVGDLHSRDRHRQDYEHRLGSSLDRVAVATVKDSKFPSWQTISKP
jgi:hypothetical protein